MTGSVGFWAIAASLILVLLAAAVGWWLRMGITRSLAIATVRAGVQLLAVGFVLRFVIESGLAEVAAWGWVIVMVVITSLVARRRAPQIPGGGWLALGAVGVATSVCMAVIFGLGVLPYEPITVIVIGGITIGNTLPSVVLAAKQLTDALDDGRGRIEALLALGFDAQGVTRFVGAGIARTALIPQIERTNVVGLIALPGAMTGLLLAGAEPIDAVLVQLIVMYLVLGSVAVSVVATVALGMRRSLTDDLRLVSRPE